MLPRQFEAACGFQSNINASMHRMYYNVEEGTSPCRDLVSIGERNPTKGPGTVLSLVKPLSWSHGR